MSQSMHLFAVPKEPKKAEGKQDDDGAVGDGDTGGNTVKLSKAEKRAKLKKMRKEAKKQGKEGVNLEEVHQTPQTDVLVWNIYIASQ